MDPSGINNFEEQWRKAFQEASETPPPALWDKIEAHLDEDEKGSVVPLWWKSAKVWYAAASVAALLVAGSLFYFNAGQKDNDVKIATAKIPAASSDHRSTATSDSVSPVGTPVPGEALIAERKAAMDVSKKEQMAALRVSGKQLASAKVKRENNTNRSGTGLESSVAALPEAGANRTDATITDQAGITADEDNIPVNASGLPENASANASIAMLHPVGYSELDVLIQQRYVFFKPQVQEAAPVQPAKNKEYWAAVGVMPATFNPDLKVKEAPTAFTTQSLSSKKSTSGTSQAGASYALQTQGGVRLSKHWSVELGLSYLKGNSRYEGGGYVLSANNSRSANVLENALADLGPSPNMIGKNDSFVNNGALYIDVAKTVSNNYQYLQLPVQAGFTLRPDKKLSYAVLAGMTANFFLSNELESASGEMITTKASDEVYRTTNWAASTGLRFSYRLSSQWNANLTGSYQKAVSSGFRSNQSLDAHPYLYGVSWGVRYTF
ncbi:outer membrane beta-barrel protein [Dyadobacter sandarakinus]|uniref:Outer membrane beta-barrel protein n=1 Tax=Dyadobacter sandarakinus TaxID=2747268 RepID=A0ABX7IAG8_9BACT|nr:outer membrane beta-barrel protein [Dyadobacter sandarakinus]QRR02939.1 outer membrane beta-barrel protein [Dyadobacter sandarakinus]